MNDPSNPARFSRGQPTGSDFGDFVVNILNNYATSRQDWLRKTGDQRRSLEDECGYDSEEWSGEQYYELYSNSPVAGRVVEMMSEACWQVNPQVYEVEDEEETTPFELAFQRLYQSLWGGRNRYLSDVGNPLWEILKRADKLCGIGRYGIILIGLDDGRPLSEPASLRPAPNLKATSQGTQKKSSSADVQRRVTFLQVFPEHLAKVSKNETDESSERFGQPTEYEIVLQDPTNTSLDAQASVGKTVKVHWTRVVHIVDNVEANEVYGVPRLRPVLRRVQDLEKLYGGSAEMYWKGAFPGLSFETHPSLGGDVMMNLESLKDTAEKYMNGLDRYLATIGISVKSLAPQVVDPSPQIERAVEAICIKMDVPKRKFLGAESGEMASSQDEDRWKEKVRSRQNTQSTPRLIVPFVNRLIDLWVLPEIMSFRVWWPDIQTQSSLEKARVAVSRTQAMVQYVQGQLQYIMTVKDYLVSVLGYTEAEARQIFENVKSRPKEELLDVQTVASPDSQVKAQSAEDTKKVRSGGDGRDRQAADAEAK